MKSRRRRSSSPRTRISSSSRRSRTSRAGRSRRRGASGLRPPRTERGRRLRSAAEPMNDEQLLRYSRHILLPELGVEGQQKILSASALVIGAGGLGSPASLYLAAAGVGTIVLADGDDVDLTNLQRQILHVTASVGRPKVESGRDALARINPDVKVMPVQQRLEDQALDPLVQPSPLLPDLSEQFATPP